MESGIYRKSRGKFKERPSWKGCDRMRREKKTTSLTKWGFEREVAGKVAKIGGEGGMELDEAKREHKKDKENGQRQSKRVMVKQLKKKTDKTDIRKVALESLKKDNHG